MKIFVNLLSIIPRKVLNYFTGKSCQINNVIIRICFLVWRASKLILLHEQTLEDKNSMKPPIFDLNLQKKIKKIANKKC